MTQNKNHPKDKERIEKAQARILRLKKKLGNWLAVGDKLGVYHVYAWKLAHDGIVPPNPDTRAKLFLPRSLPSERKTRPVKIAPPLVGSEGWEEYYLKKWKVKK